MTWTDDYRDDTSGVREIDDATAERLLAGRQVTAELEPVVTVVRTLREASAQPVRPSAELARQMAAGEFSGTPVYVYRPPLRSRLAAAVTTPGRLSLPARLAAAGAAVALVGVGTAGFAGTLPEPVQDRFESVVESVSPYDFPAKAADPDRQEGRVPQEQERDNEPGGAIEPTERPDNSGNEVGEDAKDKDKGDKDQGDKDQDDKDKDKDQGDKDKDKDQGRPDDLPPPAQDAPGQERRPTAPPGQSGN